jgi:hypothetical protein
MEKAESHVADLLCREIYYLLLIVTIKFKTYKY